MIEKGIPVLVSFSLSLSLPLSLSIYLSFRLFTFVVFFLFDLGLYDPHSSRCDARRGRMGPRCLNMRLRLRLPRLERPYNGDTCQNNWHTGVSNLPRSRWRTSTSKESWSAARRPGRYQWISVGRSGDDESSTGRRLLRTDICIRQMFFLSSVYYGSSVLFTRMRLWRKNNRLFVHKA